MNRSRRPQSSDLLVCEEDDSIRLDVEFDDRIAIVALRGVAVADGAGDLDGGRAGEGGRRPLGCCAKPLGLRPTSLDQWFRQSGTR